MTLEWTTVKPDFACVFVGKRGDDYSLWQFAWNQGEAPDDSDDDDTFHYYLAWCTGDGDDEYDDFNECEFEQYLVIAKLPTMDEVHEQVLDRLRQSYC